MLPWHHLRTKLLVVFILLLLIPLIGGGLYGHSYLSRTFYSNALRVEEQILRTQTEHIRALFVDIQNHLVFLGNLRTVKALVNTSPENPLHASALEASWQDFINFENTHPQYQQVALVNVIGERMIGVQASADGAIRVAPQADPGLLQFARQTLQSPPDTMHVALAQGESGRSSALLYAHRSAEGVVLVSLPAHELFQPVMNDNASETWSLRLPTGTALHLAPVDRPLLSPELQQHPQWQQAQSGHYTTGPDDAHTVLFDSVTVETRRGRFPLVVFHTIPTETLHADLSRYVSIYALLSSGVFLCVLSIGLFAIDRFVEPLRHLREGVDGMRRTGKPPSLPGKLPPDEVGELALAFYTMGVQLEAHRASEKALVEKLITAQEEERKRVAYDLHDGLIQQLVGAQLYVDHARQTLADDLDPDQLHVLQRGYEMVTGSIVEGRRIMQGLHPTVLDDLGLSEAIRELAEEMAQRCGWTLHLALATLDPEPNQVARVTLYRIAQEALSNSARHANAQTAHIRLEQAHDLTLIVRDDGQGFDPRTVDRGWGLRTMQERVQLLDGRIQVHSTPGDGTTIIVHIPIGTMHILQKAFH